MAMWKHTEEQGATRSIKTIESSKTFILRKAIGKLLFRASYEVSKLRHTSRAPLPAAGSGCDTPRSAINREQDPKTPPKATSMKHPDQQE